MDIRERASRGTIGSRHEGVGVVMAPMYWVVSIVPSCSGSRNTPGKQPEQSFPWKDKGTWSKIMSCHFAAIESGDVKRRQYILMSLSGMIPCLLE
jgi:hypothetical protein